MYIDDFFAGARVAPAMRHGLLLILMLCMTGPDTYAQQKSDATAALVGYMVNAHAIDKASFSCCGEERFRTAFDALDREQVLLCGIETHVCVYQTAMDLMEEDLDITVVADAVSSRTQQNKQTALTRLSDEGAAISSTEMALFELLKTARHPQFREIARLVR